MGINTTTPRGTLDIVAPRVEEEEKLKGTLLDTTNHSIVVPSLSKAEVASLTEPVNGTLVFIKDASGTNSTTKSNTMKELGIMLEVLIMEMWIMVFLLLLMPL